ncbi:MAG TPA: hypothetical protein VLF59_00495 [Candidatus Saccharimonadales bacterium]|nr:hypothetical protein [Candidatus Saccharimonadales bacterium]
MAEKESGIRRSFNIVRPDVIIKTFSSRSVKFVKLQQMHFGLSAVYLLQAVLLVVFGHTQWLPVSLDYLGADPLQSAAQGHTVLTLSAHRWFDVSLLTWLTIVLVVAAVIHALVATVLREWYEKVVQGQLNDIRWWAIGVLGGMAAVFVALILGVSDAALLAALFGLSVIMALGALAVEANKRLWPWVLFVAIAAAVVLAVGLLYGVSGMVYGTALPLYAYGVGGILAVGAAAMGANLVLQLKGLHEWNDYVFAEAGYAAIGALTLSALTWVVFAGALH